MTELPNHRLQRARLIYLMTAGAIGIMLLVVGVYQLVEFMDTTAFCGRLCHTVMYPEYTVYQASPHSRVLCSECHVGSGADYLVRSKLSGIPLVLTTIRGSYDRPIPTPVENLRPARETCEACHRPETFSGDLVRVRTTYKQDEANTAVQDTRIFRVGTGQSGVAQDIHWHIAAQVWYLPLDKERQDISWVGVVDDDGKLTEYYDMSKVSQSTPDRIEKEARLMDCIDCHNRATHQFQSPETLIDKAILQGQISPALPYIKKQAMDALGTPRSSLDEAYKKVDAIRDFYAINYPSVITQHKGDLDTAIAALREIATLTTFPYMKLTWNTYLNNLGHIESPGCYRCHGKLVGTTPGPQLGKTIDSECASCHYFQAGGIQK